MRPPTLCSQPISDCSRDAKERRVHPEPNYPPAQARLCTTRIIPAGDYVIPERLVAVTSALTDLDVRRGDRVLLMLSDGPTFVDALAAITLLGALPLPVNPLVPTRDVAAVAAEAGARLVLASVERIDTLPDVGLEPPVLVAGPDGPWAAMLRLG